MKITLFLLITVTFALAGCQSSKEVNYGYGIEMDESTDADQAKVID